MRKPSLQGKSFDVPKELVWDAWLKVKDKGGAAGPDGVTVAQFEVNAKDRLYVLWNRMSSGSYFPGPVRAVEIPKKGKKGGVRVLGIPNVVDRVAQTVLRRVLEPAVEPVFHPDSYGYRPGRSPYDALRVCRERCWRYDWVVDLDVKAFLDACSYCTFR
jgi:retron-type reverse transcriptase